MLGILIASLWFSSAGTPAQPTQPFPIAAGPFRPSMQSLQQYRCPEWFRDAKFGIWAHWGPQSMPMEGDWYARNMYIQGSRQYEDHLRRYGHPSQSGYKDIIPLWKAEKWDPDRLMKLYKAAGAKYFVSMGSHHDDFFLWNSKVHRWNAVNMGPHRDVVGDWQRAAHKYGLRFGVSEHLGASFNWFQVSHGSDKTGPKAGVPYDGANAEYQDLYHFPGDPADRGWYSTNPRWQAQWYAEIKELVDDYHPDLLYSDGGVPFGNEVGLSMIAHFYNSSAARHGGHVEAVYNCKQVSDGRWVEDLERGVMPRIDPYPWQTDTSIGDWFYNRNWRFRPVSWVIHTLVDNVSKNGNLLLNVVQRPDGTIDPEVEQMLQQLAAWNAVHGEAIYGSRPWLVYGEGTARARRGEDNAYSARDIRFTAKGGVLYALALGWPDDRKITIRSLARGSGEAVNEIQSVKLLGYSGKVGWQQTPAGLTVSLPAQPVSTYTTGLKIIGRNLKPVPVVDSGPIVTQGANGVVTLPADTSTLHGSQIQVEEKGGRPNIGYWDRADEWASWSAKVAAPGTFDVRIELATLMEGSRFIVKVGDRELAVVAPRTGSWDAFQTVDVGDVEIAKSGIVEIQVRPQDAATWKAINLRAVTLTPRR